MPFYNFFIFYKCKDTPTHKLVVLVLLEPQLYYKDHSSHVWRCWLTPELASRPLPKFGNYFGCTDHPLPCTRNKTLFSFHSWLKRCPHPHLSHLWSALFVKIFKKDMKGQVSTLVFPDEVHVHETHWGGGTTSQRHATASVSGTGGHLSKWMS